VYIVGADTSPLYDRTVVYGGDYYYGVTRSVVLTNQTKSRSRPFSCVRLVLALLVFFGIVAAIVFWLLSDDCGEDEDDECD
jgi:hypothetical protein